jgi:hypothetical protein
MTKHAPVKTVPNADLEEAIDAAVMKVAKEKRSFSNGFDDKGGVRGRISDDGYQ